MLSGTNSCYYFIILHGSFSVICSIETLLWAQVKAHELQFLYAYELTRITEQTTRNFEISLSESL